MDEYLYDDGEKDLRIRPAIIDDAAAITRLSTQDVSLSTEALDAAQHIVTERLAIASGDDYFTIVAEDSTTDEVVGWLAGGGCRGQERKGWGELYALSSDTAIPGTRIDEVLVAVGLHALRNAQFTGVTVLLERADLDRIEMFEDFGFVEGGDEDQIHDEVGSQSVRYSLSFTAST